MVLPYKKVIICLAILLVIPLVAFIAYNYLERGKDSYKGINNIKLIANQSANSKILFFDASLGQYNNSHKVVPFETINIKSPKYPSMIELLKELKSAKYMTSSTNQNKANYINFFINLETEKGVSQIIFDICPENNEIYLLSYNAYFRITPKAAEIAYLLVKK